MKYDAVVIGGGRSGCSAALELANNGKAVCLVTEGLTLDSLKPEFNGSPYKRLAHKGRFVKSLFDSVFGLVISVFCSES